MPDRNAARAARVPARRTLLCSALLLAAAGCSSHVTNTGNYAPQPVAGAAATRPNTVLVQDLQLDWQNVQLDQGLRARLERQGGNPTQEQQNTAHEVQAAITDTLVEKINAMGLHAVHAAPGVRPSPGDVVVGGQIVGVTAGNATRRNLIGFGAGKSEIDANINVSRVLPDGGMQILQTYSASSNSGRTPGLGVGAASAAAGHAAAAAAGTVAGTASRARSGLPRDGEHLADSAAVSLGQFFSQQGWIAPSAAPSAF